MEKEAKSIKSATLPLPWLEFGGGEIKREIIEALAHDLGKASQGRFGDHAEASAELLKKAGFSDKTVLHLIGKHHKFEYIKTFLEAKKHNQKVLEKVLSKTLRRRCS